MKNKTPFYYRTKQNVKANEWIIFNGYNAQSHTFHSIQNDDMNETTWDPQWHKYRCKGTTKGNQSQTAQIFAVTWKGKNCDVSKTEKINKQTKNLKFGQRKYTNPIKKNIRSIT